MWAKIKNLLSWKTGGLILGAVLMALAGQKAMRHKKRQKKAEDEMERLLQTGVTSNLKKASILQRKAKVEKKKGKDAAEATRAHLDKIGERNETINDVADRWSSKRVHKPAN